MTAPTGPQSPAWYDASSTRSHAAPSTPDPDTVRTHAVYGAPADAAPAPVPVGATPRRTVSARIAAAIGVVAFLLGFGVSMLTGPLLGGGPGGAGGPGGQGGPPGTSQQSGTGQTGTGSSTGTTSGSTSTSP